MTHYNNNPDCGWNMTDPIRIGGKCSCRPLSEQRKETERTTGQLLDEFESAGTQSAEREPRFGVGQVVDLAIGGIGQIIKVDKGMYTVRIRTAYGLEVWCLKEFELRNKSRTRYGTPAVRNDDTILIQ